MPHFNNIFTQNKYYHLIWLIHVQIWLYITIDHHITWELSNLLVIAAVVELLIPAMQSVIAVMVILHEYDALYLFFYKFYSIG